MKSSSFGESRLKKQHNSESKEFTNDKKQETATTNQKSWIVTDNAWKQPMGGKNNKPPHILDLMTSLCQM